MLAMQFETPLATTASGAKELWMDFVKKYALAIRKQMKNSGLEPSGAGVTEPLPFSALIERQRRREVMDQTESVVADKYPIST